MTVPHSWSCIKGTYERLPVLTQHHLQTTQFLPEIASVGSFRFRYKSRVMFVRINKTYLRGTVAARLGCKQGGPVQRRPAVTPFPNQRSHATLITEHTHTTNSHGANMKSNGLECSRFFYICLSWIELVLQYTE